MPRGQAGTGTSGHVNIRIPKNVIDRIDAHIKAKLKKVQKAAEEAGLDAVEYSDRQVAVARTKFVNTAIEKHLTAETADPKAK